MQIGLIELFGMEEIKQYINLQMRKMLEIFEKIIKFDIFFQEKEFKKSKSIFSYIVFIFLSVGSYISIFPERLVINTNLLSNPKTILFILQKTAARQIKDVISFYLFSNSLFIFHILHRFSIGFTASKNQYHYSS